MEREMCTPHNQLCAAIEEYIQSTIPECDQLAGNKGISGMLIERASAAVYRVLSEKREADYWLYLRIGVESTVRANFLIAHRIAPMLNDLKQGPCAIKGWWWLRKSDTIGNAIRLRIVLPVQNSRKITRIIHSSLYELGCDFVTLHYEPEFRLFGGTAGIKIAHNHFCADSEFLARWMLKTDPVRLPVIPEGLSLALIFRLLQASGLDLFETWDVFDKICAKRPGPRDQQEPMPAFQRLAEKIIHSTPARISQLFEEPEASWLSEYGVTIDRLGRELNEAYFRGELECGLREFLAPIVLFHWNRAGMPGVAQSHLSHAVALELRRLSRAGETSEKDTGK